MDAQKLIETQAALEEIGLPNQVSTLQVQLTGLENQVSTFNARGVRSVNQILPDDRGDVEIPASGGIVKSVVAGTNITVNNTDPTNPIVSAAGAGVTSITGTTNQIIASASTGAVTLSTPQNIDTGASVTFLNLNLNRTISWYNASWLYRREITINNTQLEALTNFTVRIFLTSSNFTFANAQTAGQDIRFTAADGVTLLNYEIKSWNPLANTAYIRVLVPTIDANSANDSIFMYYGNAAASDAQNPSGTYDSHAVLRAGLPNGSTLSANDSTSSPSNGTLVNTPTAVSSLFDGGGHFVASSSQYIDFGNPSKLQITSNLTLSSVVKLTDTSHSYMVLTKDGDTGGRAYTLDFDSGAFRFYINGGSSIVTTTSSISSATSYLLTATYNPLGVLKIYLNGQLQATITGGASSIPSATANVQAAARVYSGAQSYLNGDLSDLVIDNTDRSATWIAADYQNLINNFLTVGYEEGILVTNEINTLNLIANSASINTLDVTTINVGSLSIGTPITLSNLTTNEVPYTNSSLALIGSTGFTFDGTNLLAPVIMATSGPLLSGYSTNPGVVTGLDVAGTSRLGRQGQTDGSTTIAGILSVTFNSSGNSGFNFLAPNQNDGAIINLNNNTAGEKDWQIGAGGHNTSGGGGTLPAEGTFSIANSTDGIFGFILEGYNSHNMHLGGNITGSAGAGSILDLIYSTSVAQFNGVVKATAGIATTAGSAFSILVGSSPFTYTNSSSTNIQLFIENGSGISAISYLPAGSGGITINGLVDNILVLRPTDAVTITYTVTTPVMNYVIL